MSGPQKRTWLQGCKLSEFSGHAATKMGYTAWKRRTDDTKRHIDKTGKGQPGGGASQESGVTPTSAKGSFSRTDGQPGPVS